MNALVVQCGGPTAVLNASLAAVIARRQAAGTGRLFGARRGMQGLVLGDWVELPRLAPSELAALAAQPGAALGSSRFKLDEAGIAAALEQLDARAVGCLFLIGGNGTMAAAQRIEAAASGRLRVVGIPKTVDNDLPGTDVTPGYASAARYLAWSVADVALDLRAMASFEDVVAVEVMGRHAGWLAAASALARHADGDPPDLILLPEAPIESEDALLERIAAVHRSKGSCLVVAAEGARDGSGGYLAERLGSGGHDDRGQRVLSMAGGVAAWLADRVQVRLGLRCRQVRPNTMQRSGRALVSPVDRELAWRVGEAAVRLACDGASSIMVGLVRAEDAAWEVQPVPLQVAGGQERHLPPAMIDGSAWGVSHAFVEYALPLVGALPPPPLLWG